MIKIEKSIYLTSEIKCNLGNLTKSTSNNDALAYNGYEVQPTIVNIGGVFQGPISVSVINNSISNLPE